MNRRPTILVTGSSGLIGAALCKRLIKACTVIGFDRIEPPDPPSGTHVIHVDMAQEDSLREGLELLRREHGDHLDAVVHLAAYYNFSGEPSSLYQEITVQGTRRLLQGLQAFTVGRFIFSSTMLVHAPGIPGVPINEDSPLGPTWDYPRSKLATEQLILELHDDIPVALLRIAGVYTDRCLSIPLAHQIERIWKREITSRLFPGDVSHGQSFVHLDDLLDASERVMERSDSLPPGTVLLLGEPEVASYDRLQHAFARALHGEDWETREIPKTLAKLGAWMQDHLPGMESPFIKPWMIERADDHYEIDISRARALLGWEPKHRLLDSVPVMVAGLHIDPVAWLRDNGIGTAEAKEPVAVG